MSAQNELAQIFETLGIPYETLDSGSWFRLPRPDGSVRYVVRGQLSDGYFAWVDYFTPQRVEWYRRLEDALGLTPSRVP